MKRKDLLYSIANADTIYNTLSHKIYSLKFNMFTQYNNRKYTQPVQTVPKAVHESGNFGVS